MPEMSLAGFAGLLAEVSTEMARREREALDEATRIVQTEAKAEIGTYQGAAGPFPAWEELADSTKDDRVRQGFTENDPGLRSGEMRESVRRTVVGREGHVGSDDEHMVFFELGTSKQPPRTVLAGSLLRKAPEVVEALGRRVFGRLTGNGVHADMQSLEGRSAED